MRKFILAFCIGIICLNASPALAQLSNSQFNAYSKFYGLRFLSKTYACLIDAMSQRIPIKQALEQCKIELKDFGNNMPASVQSLPEAFGLGDTTLDSAEVVSACKGVDPAVASGTDAGGTGGSTPAAGKENKSKAEAAAAAAAAAMELAKAKAAEAAAKAKEALAEQARNQAEKKLEEKSKNLEEAKAKGASEEEVDKIRTEVMEARFDADARGGDLTTAHNETLEAEARVAKARTRLGWRPLNRAESRCEQIMAEAREIIRHCNKTQWKAPGCSKLLGNCKPELMLVDPDSGFSCVRTMDAEAVKNAYVKHCQMVTKPGPDGVSPCVRAKVEEGGFVISGANADDVCQPGNPRAYIDPSSDICYFHLGEVELPGPKQKTIEELIAIAHGRFGGPIIVLPKSGPLPFPPKG